MLREDMIEELAKIPKGYVGVTDPKIHERRKKYASVQTDQILQLLPKHREEVINLLYPDKKLAVLSDDQDCVCSIDHFSWCDYTPEDAYERACKDYERANFKRIEEEL